MLSRIYLFYNVHLYAISEFYAEDINFENWTEASNDPTLKKVAAIFDGSYLEKNIELNGIIQVFNIYNIANGINTESSIMDVNTEGPAGAKSTPPAPDNDPDFDTI